MRRRIVLVLLAILILLPTVLAAGACGKQEKTQESPRNLEEFLPADTLGSKMTRVCDLERPGDAYTSPQGGYTDGVYHYQAWVCQDAASDEADNRVRIVKTELSTGKVIAVSQDLALNHANDITYNAALDRLVVVHNKPNKYTVSFIDPETLEITDTGQCPKKIYAMHYSAARNQYVVGLSGGQSFRVLDSELAATDGGPFEPTDRTKGYTTQGMTGDERYLYFVLYRQSAITVYDWDGNFVTLIELDDAKGEAENISVVGNYIYVTVYLHGGNTTVYRVDPVAEADR